MSRWRGLYAVTDGAGAHEHSGADPRSLADRVALAIDGGAVMVQYRDKSGDRQRREREAGALRAVCARAAVPLIINDDVELAAHVGAEGVHLGREDAAPEDARRILGERAIIGVSCYNSLERARRAAEQGADYLAFGRFFPSRTKPGAVPAALSLLAAARAELDLPLVAIGGITPDNGARLIEAGADLLAVIHGVFGQSDPCSAARAYARLFR